MIWSPKPAKAISWISVTIHQLTQWSLIPKQQEMFLIYCLCWPLPLLKTQHSVVARSFNFDSSERTITNTEQYIQQFRSSGMWSCIVGLTLEDEGKCSFKELGTAHLMTQQHIPEGPDHLHSCENLKYCHIKSINIKKTISYESYPEQDNKLHYNWTDTCLEDISNHAININIYVCVHVCLLWLFVHTHTHTHTNHDRIITK